MNFLELTKRYETAICIFSLYNDGKTEVWHCEFKSKDHPVNKKRELFKMSGAEQE